MTTIFKDIKLIGKATQTIETLKQQSEYLKSQIVQLQDQQNETLEENDLLLQQLHQVQEELEHYFLQHQDANKTLASTQHQLDRVLADNPSYYSYENIECQPIGLNPNRLHWTISGLMAAGRYWERCEFETFLENGIAGFEFSKEESPLLVWPQCIANESKATCIPTGTPENASQRAHLLDSLSASDWRLLKTLPKVLFESIKHKETHTQEDNLLDQGLQKTLDILLNHLPQKLRFDKVELKRILVHPGYEHLSFLVKNLIYANQAHPLFEFRFGCSNISLNCFGTDPKLEFPKQSGKPPLESWFEESEDEFGPKLELRFALPDAMDLDVWAKLKPKDKKMIGQLIDELIGIIDSQKGVFHKRNRPITEWISLACELNKIFKKHQ